MDDLKLYAKNKGDNFLLHQGIQCWYWDVKQMCLNGIKEGQNDLQLGGLNY